MQWSLILIILGLGIKYTEGIWPVSYKVDLKDKQTFVISSDEDCDENENEMIQRDDISGIESFVEDEQKYEPLHSHVKNYNRRAAEKADRLSRSIYFHPITEVPFKEEPKPFIAGFKPELDKYVFEKLENPDHTLKKRSPKFDTTTIKASFRKQFSATPAIKNLGYVKSNHKRIKRSNEDDDSSTEFFEGFSNRKFMMSETTESEIKESVQSQSAEFFSTEKDIRIEFSSTEKDIHIEFSSTEKDMDMKVDFANLDLTTTRTTVSEIFEYQDEVEETTLAEYRDEINLDRIAEKTITSDTETSEDYDYDKLKAEYYQQIEEIQKRNETFNYTDRGEPEETAKDVLKKIVDFKMPKNCTKEELSQIGVKAFECLIYDYQHAKNKTDVKKVFDRTWMIIKIWIFIYICIAIPCWCQRGWCCCCFCCEICFPKEIILAERKYFAENPPGTLVKRTKKDKQVKMQTVNYKPTLFEYEAYEKLESAIRNI